MSTACWTLSVQQRQELTSLDMAPPPLAYFFFLVSPFGWPAVGDPWRAGRCELGGDPRTPEMFKTSFFPSARQELCRGVLVGTSAAASGLPLGLAHRERGVQENLPRDPDWGNPSPVGRLVAGRA